MRISLAAAGILIAALSSISAAQNTNPDKPSSPPPQGKSKVIFERSTDSASQGKDSSPASGNVSVAVTDTERQAVSYANYDLDIRLHPAEQGLAVRALITLRNDGTAPLARIPLQISSSLNWESIRLQKKEVPYRITDLKSDEDHTGLLHEAVISLPEPLAPGKEIQFDVVYSGKIELSHQRLDAIQTPPDVADYSDWDRISPEFIGLRGFGNVVWYPVTSAPAFLGKGSKVIDLLREQKARQSAALIKMAVKLEYVGAPPNVAILNGQVVPVSAPAGPASPDAPQIATFQLDEARLGVAVPTLFVAVREEHLSPSLRVYSRAETSSAVQGYTTAAAMVTPLLKDWLGSNQRVPLTIVDLPEAEDVAFDAGSVLLVPLEEAAPEQYAADLLPLLTHTWFQSSRPWLNEGVVHFMDTLWIERQKDHETAVASLEASRRALALVEPASPQDGPGQPLLDATSPVYLQTKTSYVFWMLRDLVGDEALMAALHAYRASQDTEPDSFEKLLESKAKGKDLSWFFHDWVYTDRGLPDLSIAGVYTNTAAVADSYVVAVDIANEGWASAEVPVTVRSQKTAVTERVLIPAHEKLVHRIVILGTPTEVQVNDGAVPEVQSSIHVRQVDGATPQR